LESVCKLRMCGGDEGDRNDRHLYHGSEEEDFEMLSEEKKQEDELELRVPRVQSDDFLWGTNAIPMTIPSSAACSSSASSASNESCDHHESIITSTLTGVADEVTSGKGDGTGSLQCSADAEGHNHSDGNSGGGSDDVSAISPLPLCGLMGNWLQCLQCNHARLIRDTPFFDISVVPTAVSASQQMYHGQKVASYNGNNPAPCRLEDCLQHFTSVERVREVECCRCTYKDVLGKLEEETLMLKDTIQYKLSQGLKQGLSEDACSVSVMHLRNDLQPLDEALYKLQSCNPDDESSLEEVLAMLNNQTNEEDASLFVDPCCSETKYTMLKHDSFKRLMLTRLPTVLCLHVQRRYYNPVANQMCKTLQHVIFPEFLDATPYCSSGQLFTQVEDDTWTSSASLTHKVNGSPARFCERTQSAVDSPKRESTHPAGYRLMSVIEHRGGANSGHYVCYRRRDKRADDTDWLYISDQDVRPVSWEQVRGCQAYMLFYEAL
jgi:Ubiquitin carboxyl-terminal hydrolase